MAKEKRGRTDAEYIALNDALLALAGWAPEINEELNRRGYSERYLTVVIDAAWRVHSPEE